jgi:hypothetical protein
MGGVLARGNHDQLSGRRYLSPRLNIHDLRAQGWSECPKQYEQSEEQSNCRCTAGRTKHRKQADRTNERLATQHGSFRHLLTDNVKGFDDTAHSSVGAASTIHILRTLWVGDLFIIVL